MKKQSETDEGQALRSELRMSTYIKEMDAEVRERFMALKVMEDQLKDITKEEQKEIRKLEIEFENKYQEIYRLRTELTLGKSDPDA
jgi:uncharacterized protein YnzC (UPF0291/DUF896 family)